jgi:tetratricopeptide (TPR) repeat protein
MRQQEATVTLLLCHLGGVGTPASGNGYADPPSGAATFLAIARDLLKGRGAKLDRSAHGLSDRTILAVFEASTSGNHALDALTAGVELQRMRRGNGNGQGTSAGPGLRTGVSTGEVLLTFLTDDEVRVEGDAVDAARLLISMQQGSEGEILFSPHTHDRVLGMVLAEPLSRGADRPPPEQLTAWRLQSILRNVTPGAPLVGREEQLDTLRELFEDIRQEQDADSAKDVARFVTIVGDPGVGKSRLVQEFVRTLGSEASVLLTHCAPLANLAYGPIAQIMRRAAKIEDDDPPDTARSKLQDLWDDAGVVTQLSGLLSLPPGTSSDDRGPLETTGELDDMRLAVSAALLGKARVAPLVLVFEDLQWAHPMLLSFIINLAKSLRRSRVLFICLARPEFKPPDQATTTIAKTESISLRRLGEQATSELLDHLLERGRVNDEVRTDLLRGISAASGHPLFIEALIVTFEDQGTLQLVDGTWSISDPSRLPLDPEINSFLQDCLYRLEPTAREVARRASVIGPHYAFTAEELAKLFREPDAAIDLQETLEELVGKQLLEPVATSRGGAVRWFRFRHVLIREAAYRLLDERQRAELHEQYGAWCERNQTPSKDPLVEHTIGYHYDQAQRLLGRLDDRNAATLAEQAAQHLVKAAHGYLPQGDLAAAMAVLLRAVELFEASPGERLQARLELADARCQDHRQSRETLEKALAEYEQSRHDAKALGNEIAEQHALLGRIETQLFLGIQLDDQAALRELEESIAVFGVKNDALRLAKAWHLRSWILAGSGRSSEAANAAERALDFVRGLDNRLEARIRRTELVILFWGPQPLDEVKRHTARTLEWARPKGMFSLVAGAHSILARAAAMECDFAEARRNFRDPQAWQRDPGELLAVSAEAIAQGFVELYAGNLDKARLVLQENLDAQKARGTTAVDVAALLARVLVYQDRFDGSMTLIDFCAKHPPWEGHDTQIKWRQLKARVLAHTGALEEAERLAQEAVERSERSEHFDSRGEALLGLAEILRRRKVYTRAADAAANALETYEAKGDARSARRARRLLERIDQSARLPARRAEATLVAANPPLIVGHPVTITFRIAEDQDVPTGRDGGDDGPPNELLVMLTSRDAEVRPLGYSSNHHEGGHRVLLPAKGGTEPVRFQIVPHAEGSAHLRFRVHLAQEGSLLQELTVSLPVADPDTGSG